jgi:uroporphyrinogen-III synthase
LNVVAIGAGDGASLAGEIVAGLPAQARLLYPCGRVRTEGFEAALAATGIAVTPVEIYDAVTIEYEPEELGARIGAAAPWAALVHSPAGGRLLASLLSRPETAPFFAGMRIFGISENAVTPLKTLVERPVEAANEPSDAALLALITAKV